VGEVLNEEIKRRRVTPMGGVVYGELWLSKAQRARKTSCTLAEKT